MIWQITGDLFDRYPADDFAFHSAIMGVLFLTTLAPVFLNLLLNDSESVQRLSAVLLPISLAGVFALLALLWLRLNVRRGGAAGRA